MPKIPGISPAQAVRALEKVGFRVIREGKHIVISDGLTRLTIPRHNSINAYTMGAIARDADLTPEEFKKAPVTGDGSSRHSSSVFERTPATIATIPRLSTSGSLGHAPIRTCRSGSPVGVWVSFACTTADAGAARASSVGG